jgi:hypothetical protein
MRRRINTGCVVRVDGGRGFIVVHRVKVQTGPRGRKFVSVSENRLVVTAAHCLPHLPQTHAPSSYIDRTYEDLLTSLNGNEKNVWAECLFADPVADIAVLGCPEEQELDEQASAYDSLTKGVSFLSIGKPKSGLGWVRSLDNRWIRSKLEVFSGLYGVTLSIYPPEPGMSGSPILNDIGQAIGVVSIGTETTSASGEQKNESFCH